MQHGKSISKRSPGRKKTKSCCQGGIESTIYSSLIYIYIFFERYDFLYIFYLFYFQSIKDDPFVIKEKSKDGSISFKGYCIDLLEELARNLHFTYDIYTTPDGNYGAETENGTWNGMIGELITRVGIKQSIHFEFFLGERIKDKHKK